MPYLTEKDPKKGYLGTQLLLPLQYINTHAIQQALTFILPDRENVADPITEELIGIRNKELRLWDSTKHHLIVPREFFAPKVLLELQNTFEIIDERPPSFPKINIKAKTPLWEEQYKPFKAMIANDGGTLNLACGRGKTSLALHAAAEYGVPTLIVTNTNALMEQWRTEIEKHLEIESVGLIQESTSSWRQHPITLASVHTIAARPELRCAEFRNYFGLVFYDEGHHMAAPVFAKAADLVAGRRFSLTATADRTDGLEMIYQYHLGRVFYKDLSQQLIPQTIFHVLDWMIPSNEVYLTQDKTGHPNTSRLRTYLGTVEARNRFITETINNDLVQGKVVLVLSHSVDHVKTLHDMCQSPTKGIIIGAIKDNRVLTLRESNPVFGTFQLAREGLDKPTLNALHICTLFSNSNDLQQAWGRTQRHHEGKQNPIVHVYEDNNIKACVRSGRALRKYLKAMKYPFTRRKSKI